jgi:hypothetical protein
LRDDFDIFTEAGALADFWQRILVFSIAALILTADYDEGARV